MVYVRKRSFAHQEKLFSLHDSKNGDKISRLNLYLWLDAGAGDINAICIKEIKIYTLNEPDDKITIRGNIMER